MRDHRRRSGYENPPQFAREFRPESLDLDHLAGAVRKLLGADVGLREEPDSDLLLARPGVTDVVGVNGEP